MERRNSNAEMEIDLKDLFFALLVKWQYILASALFIGGITAIVNQYVLVPQYASTAKLSVLSKSTSITSLADVQVGTSLTQDYMIIIKGRSVVSEVNKKLNLHLSYEELSGKVTVENPSNTRILNIRVTDTDPERAKKIADCFAEVSSEYIADKMDQKAPKIIEYGYASKQHVYPAKRKNVCLGILMGGFLAAAVVTILYLMDDTIKSSDDVEKYLGLHTLASIPDDGHSDKEAAKRKKKKKGAK